MLLTKPNLRNATAAFSLIELVIVVVIIGILAAIAIPRISSASATAKANALTANVNQIQSAIDRYIVEHNGLSPAQKPDGSIDTDATAFFARLTSRTLETGAITASSVGALGPYLRTVPPNPYSQSTFMEILTTGRVSDSDGYLFDTRTNAITPGTIETATVASPVTFP